MEMGLFSLEITIKAHEANPWKTLQEGKDNYKPNSSSIITLFFIFLWKAGGFI